MSEPRLLGAVLAGGEGRRFGGPKAEAEVGGVALVTRAVDTVREVLADVVIVSSGRIAGPTAPVLPDLTPGTGPLGGLQAALVAARDRGLDGVLLVACDLPLLTPALLRRVVRAFPGRPAVAPERAGGGVEPLCAAYGVEVLAAVEARLEHEDRSLHGLFRTVSGHVLPGSSLGVPASAFLNVNTPADRRRAEEALARPLPPIVCVVGKKKSGKTLTATGLMAELSARGHLVMAAKHGHGFELDHEGTDSYRHRHEGGAHRVALAGPEQLAVVGGWGSGGERPLEQLVEQYLADADVVVAEGFKASGAPKVEVYRRAAHDRPLYGTDPDLDRTYLALLTDVPDFDASVPVLDVDDPGRFHALADLVEARVMQRAPGPAGGRPVRT